MATVLESSITLATPLKRNIPANVHINGGICTYPISQPCHIPITHATASDNNIAIKGFVPTLNNFAESAADKQSVDPTDKSTLPPVSIHRSIPQAIIRTYAFCKSKFDIFCARRSLPPVRYVKNTNTTKSASTIVYFFTNLFAFIFNLLFNHSTIRL